jgi:hypothetical protein
VVSAGAVRNPFLVSESGDITPEIQRFVQDYNPDYIYTLGMDYWSGNSFQITKEDVSRLFFPNTTKAVYAASKEKGIFASLIGNYLGIPVVFDKAGNYSEFLDLEAMTIPEIENLYLDKVQTKKGKIDYLLLTDLNSSEALLAGYIAGMRNEYIVHADDKSLEGIKGSINHAIGKLGSRGLYQKAVDYKMGKPLYLAILGGNDSIPYVRFFDPGLEIFNDKDGWYLYSDLRYSDSNDDGFFDLALGRMEGLGATSLHMARQFLPKNQSAVVIGEYRYPKFEDLKNFGGGMTQALITQIVLEGLNIKTKRIVEQRIAGIPDNMTKEEASGRAGEILLIYSLKTLLGTVGLVWSVLDVVDDKIMYGLLELDWWDWSGRYMGIIPVPMSLEVIDESLPDKIGSAGVVGYFGVGKIGWTIPKQNRSYLELIAGPYDGGTEINDLGYSGFVYDDHDMSASSGIRENVIRNGGGILTSSGIIHDPYTMRTSTVFFTKLAYGESLGEALMDSANINIADSAVDSAFLTLIWAPVGDLWGVMTSPLLYVKDKFERILFSDPAVSPLEKKPLPWRTIYTVGPAGSFKAESAIKSNYTIEDDRLDVWNADDYLIEKEKPITPVFVREFVLPEDSVVNWVNVSGSYSFSNASPVLVYNDSYYSDYMGILGGCIANLNITREEDLEPREAEIFACMENAVKPNASYPYPNSTFWWREYRLLDNRTLVYVFVPAVLFENGSSASVLENASVQVDYEAWTEMNVLAQDVFVGQNETVKLELMNLGEEASGTVWVFVEGNGSFEFSEDVTIPVNSNLTKEFSFAPEIGDYGVTAVFDSNSSIGPRYTYFHVDEAPPARAVPEMNESEMLFLIKPAHYSGKSLSVRNSGNVSLEAEISCEGFTGISCEINPQMLNLLPGEQSDFSVNISVPGGHTAGIYEGKIMLQGNEFAEPKTIEMPLKISVPEVAYWSISPLEWICNLPDCSRDFIVTNSPDSNAPLHADITSENLDLVSVQDDIFIEPGREKNVTATAGIAAEGVLSGVYTGNITFEASGNSEPSQQKINVILTAGGPNFTLQKEFQPEKIMLFWKQFVLPKINHVEIYLNNTGDVPIEKINLSDEIPDGWKGKKPAISFVKRNKTALVKEFSFFSGNGYANFSFDFTGKPLKKGEGLEVHYLIYSQPEFAPTVNIVTVLSGEARGHDNIYSREQSPVTLKVEYLDPPAWLRWLFILIYRLW